MLRVKNWLTDTYKHRQHSQNDTVFMRSTAICATFWPGIWRTRRLSEAARCYETRIWSFSHCLVFSQFLVILGDKTTKIGRWRVFLDSCPLMNSLRGVDKESPTNNTNERRKLVFKYLLSMDLVGESGSNWCHLSIKGSHPSVENRPTTTSFSIRRHYRHHTTYLWSEPKVRFRTP